MVSPEMTPLPLLVCVRVVVDAQFGAGERLSHVADAIAHCLDRTRDWTMAGAARLGSVWLLRRLQALRQCGGMRDFKDALVVQHALEAAAAAGHVAVLHWFADGAGHDVLSQRECAAPLVTAATSTAQLAVLQWLDARWPLCELSCSAGETIGRVAALGSLECSAWLLERIPCGPGEMLHAMEQAATYGYLRVVERIHQTLVTAHPDAATAGTVKLSGAARRAQLAVLQWFHAHRPDDIRGYLLSDAAASGALHVIEWLHAVRTHSTGNALASIFALSSAAANGHLLVVQWLLQHRSEEFPGSTLHLVARNGHLHVLQWLYGHPQCKEYFFDGATSYIGDAAEGGHLEVVQWLHAVQPAGLVAWRPIDVAAANGHLEVVKWLHTHRSDGCCARAMDLAATNGHLEVVEFLHHHRSEGCTTDAMDGAARNGHLQVVRFLHANRLEGCTRHAMDEAAANNKFDVVRFFHANRHEGGTTQVMNSAARHGNIDMLAFLHEHRPEGCDEKALSLAVSCCGRLDVVQWLVDQYPALFRREQVLRSVLQRNVRVTKGVRHIANYLRRVRQELVEAAADEEDRRRQKRVRGI